METIEAQEIEKYQKIWQKAQYRVNSPGQRYTRAFLGKLLPAPGESVLDVGCGTGRAGYDLFVKGLRVTMIDIAGNCLDYSVAAACDEPGLNFHIANAWKMPEDIGPHDYIFCVDVLEHLPREKIPAALNCMKARMIKGGLLNIALFDDKYYSSLIGAPLHLTVESRNYWRDMVARFFTVQERFEMQAERITFIIRPYGT